MTVQRASAHLVARVTRPGEIFVRVYAPRLPRYRQMANHATSATKMTTNGPALMRCVGHHAHLVGSEFFTVLCIEKQYTSYPDCGDDEGARALLSPLRGVNA